MKSHGTIRREHSYLVKNTVSVREKCKESRGREVRVTEKLETEVERRRETSV